MQSKEIITVQGMPKYNVIVVSSEIDLTNGPATVSWRDFGGQANEQLVSGGSTLRRQAYFCRLHSRNEVLADRNFESWRKVGMTNTG